MSRELLDILEDSRQRALSQVQRIQVSRELPESGVDVDYESIRHTAACLEIAVLSLFSDELEEDDEDLQKLRLAAAADAFCLLRALPRPDDSLEAGVFLLRAGALAVLGGKGADASLWLRESGCPELPVDSQDWSERAWATVVDAWLRLIRRNGREDRDLALKRISDLRDAQSIFEKEYLQNLNGSDARAAAFELIALYHLAKAAEILAHCMTDGTADGKCRTRESLKKHFDQASAACGQSAMIRLGPLSMLLSVSAAQMAENSTDQPPADR